MEKLKWHTEQRRVLDLVPYAINPRTMSARQKQNLAESINEFDLVEIPAINLDNTLLAGHRRCERLVMDGRGEELIDVRVPNRLLDETEVKRYNFLSNAVKGDFVTEMLEEHFSDIGVNFDDFGFEFLKEEDVVSVSELKIKEEEIVPYKKVHVLISFSPELMMKISKFLEQIKNTEGVEYEQAAN